MGEIIDKARQPNRETRPASALVWSAAFQINSREFLRAELRLHNKRLVLDLRRWVKPPDGAALPTGRGVAISARHLSSLDGLVGAAIEAVAGGLLNDLGEPR